MITKKWILLVSVCFATVVAGTSGAAAQDKPPNIVILLVDDLGWRDVSFNGGVIATPNIDRIADEGVRLNRFYVAPVCGPTRAGLMTGRYPIRYGMMRGVVMGYHDFGLDPEATIIPQVLATAGYEQRGIFGKWHLGESRAAYRPMQRGFTHFIGHVGSHIDYFTHEVFGEVDWFHGNESKDEPGYSTDLIADHAVQFLEDHAGGDAPFFLYVPFNAPHSPYQAKSVDLPRYGDLEGISIETELGPDIPPDKYEWIGGHASRRERFEDPAGMLNNRRITGAMIHALDQGIRRILDTLEESGVDENTLVWFMSDNGGASLAADNRPFRGAKGSVFEGGIRVAAAARWPAGGVAGGKAVDAALNYLDVLPTLMTVAGLDEGPELALDGMNVLPALKGEPFPVEREYYSYCGQLDENREHVTAMDGDWKLIVIGPPLTERRVFGRSELFLFDLAKDPGERDNLVKQHPEIVARLSDQALAFRALQPEKPVPLFATDREGFVAPHRWELPRAR